MSELKETVFIGLHGFVLALNRSTGEELWRVRLKGDFVNLTLDGDQLLATAQGEIFCLDAATGTQKWHNKLTGLGLGLITLVTASSPTASITSAAEHRHREEAAAGAAASVTT